MNKLLLLLLVTVFMVGCEPIPEKQQKSDSGVKKTSVQIKTNSEGLSSEQVNVKKRLVRDNTVGSVKHLYIISSYTGDVMEYSTVMGKVTSGGKRLSPRTVIGNGFENAGNSNYVILNGDQYTTDEVLDDGGTYGDSGNYLYWFDAQDNYHQYYPSGGTYLHISDRPLRIKKANFSVTMEKK